MKMHLKEHSKRIIIVMFITMIVGIGFLFPDIRNYTNRFVSGSASSLNICKSGMIYRSEISDSVVNSLDTGAGIPYSYIAAKELSQNGFLYFLLVNYNSHTQLITYYASGGVKVKLLSKKQGNDLFSQLATTEYKDARSYYGGSMFHDSCNFIRVSDSNNRYDYEILNPDISIDDPIIRINSNIHKLLMDQYLNETMNGISFQIPDEPDKSEFNEWDIQINEDLFFELNSLNRN